MNGHQNDLSSVNPANTNRDSSQYALGQMSMPYPGTFVPPPLPSPPAPGINGFMPPHAYWSMLQQQYGQMQGMNQTTEHSAAAAAANTEEAKKQLQRSFVQQQMNAPDPFTIAEMSSRGNLFRTGDENHSKVWNAGNLTPNSEIALMKRLEKMERKLQSLTSENKTVNENEAKETPTETVQVKMIVELPPEIAAMPEIPIVHSYYIKNNEDEEKKLAVQRDQRDDALYALFAGEHTNAQGHSNPFLIPAGKSYSIRINGFVELPQDCSALVSAHPKSAQRLWRSGIYVVTTSIGPKSRGAISVRLENKSDTDYRVRVGELIAAMRIVQNSRSRFMPLSSEAFADRMVYSDVKSLPSYECYKRFSKHDQQVAIRGCIEQQRKILSESTQSKDSASDTDEQNTSEEEQNISCLPIEELMRWMPKERENFDFVSKPKSQSNESVVLVTKQDNAKTNPSVASSTKENQKKQTQTLPVAKKYSSIDRENDDDEDVEDKTTKNAWTGTSNLQNAWDNSQTKTTSTMFDHNTTKQQPSKKKKGKNENIPVDIED